MPNAAGNWTLGELMDAARQRADMVKSRFIEDPELISYVNQAALELYDLLVDAFEGNYNVAPPVSLTTDGQADTYALPDGTNFSAAPAFYKLLAVDLYSPSAAARYVPLTRFNVGERNMLALPNLQGFPGSADFQYALRGKTIWFNPTPAAGKVVRLLYIPLMTYLAQRSDVLDSCGPWAEYVIVDTAIRMMQKEESDVSVLFAQKQALTARVQGSAKHRDAGNPPTVNRVRRDPFGFHNPGLGGGFGPWGY